MDERAEGWLAEERVTHLIIGAFFRVYNRLGYGFLEHVYAAPRQLLNYLRATNLEVGLLLHFGPEAKFYRLFAPNARKQHSDNPQKSE